MKSKNAPKPTFKTECHEHDTPREGEYPEISNVASAQECTGLMYRTPKTQAELENLRRLSTMAIPKEQ